MNIPPEIQADIDPTCPLSTRLAVDLYTTDLSEYPPLDFEDPEYSEKAYLSYLDHLDDIEQLHCDLSEREKIVCAGLHAIAWVMVSNHIHHAVSIYDVYLAMCDYEKKQNDFIRIDQEGFLLQEGES